MDTLNTSEKPYSAESDTPKLFDSPVVSDQLTVLRCRSPVQLNAASPTWCPAPVCSSGGPDGGNTHASVPLSHLSSSSRAVGWPSADAPGAVSTRPAAVSRPRPAAVQAFRLLVMVIT